MKGGHFRLNGAPLLPLALLCGGEHESCIHMCVRTNFMQITVIQADWQEMSEVPQRIKYWAVGQQLASITEFGSEWQCSQCWKAQPLEILAGILALPVISSVVWAKLINLNLCFLIYKMKS